MLSEEILGERGEVASYVIDRPLCPYRASLTERFQTAAKELARHRRSNAGSRQRYDLALRGSRISARPSPFIRLALQQRRELRGVERLNGQPPTYFALNLREWRQLTSLAEEGTLTLEPALREAVEAAAGGRNQAAARAAGHAPERRRS